MEKFVINDKEWQNTLEWQNKHLAEAHPILSAGGAIGGRFSYEFIPTGIGTIGKCKCSCGESFTFAEI